MAPTGYPKPLAGRRAKAVAKSQSLLASHGVCRMYGFGVTGPDPNRSWLWIAGGAIGACVLLMLATGAVLVPGFLLIAGVRWGINTPRGVLVADQGIAVTRESFWNARPTSVIVLLPFDPLFLITEATGSHVRVQLGIEHIWLRRREHEIVTTAAHSAMARTGARPTAS
jgi:hypothetical protein